MNPLGAAATSNAKAPQKKPSLKTVVRKLPPHLPADTFIQVVQPWINDTCSDWFTYIAGKLSKG